MNGKSRFRGAYRSWGKRCFDLLVSVPLLVLTSPLMFVIAVVVRIADGSPTLFRQQRAGLNGRTFVLLKFRTMNEVHDARGFLLSDAARTTRTGQLLRRLSLDELPQLWNILRGQMSLVGPRPLLPEYVERYSPWQRKRLEVLPGLTGWAQVNGRNAVDWETRFEFDVQYVERLSFRFDLYILARTIIAVLLRRDIDPAGSGAMEEFLGSSSAGPSQTVKTE